MWRHGEHFSLPALITHHAYWLQVRYPAHEPALPLGLSGTHFRAVFGSNQSMLEAVILKRHLKGPSWLLIKHPFRREGSDMVGVGVVASGTLCIDG